MTEPVDPHGVPLADLPGPPRRETRYWYGPSTPRQVRVNDRLWADFAIAAEGRGWSAAEALKWLMEQWTLAEGVLPKVAESALGVDDLRAERDR